MNKLTQKLHKKKKGFALTLECMAASVMFALILAMCTFTLTGMERQKLMFNALVSGVSQTARWGGTNTTMYQTYSKDGMDIASITQAEIERATNGHATVNLTITPENVQTGGETIYGNVTWRDVGTQWLHRYVFGGKDHSIDLQTESIVTKGILLHQ